MTYAIKFPVGYKPVIKHEGGGHDQSSHGSWANSSERSAKEIEIQQRITQVENKSYPVDEDGMVSNRVTAIYETKDGTKIKLLHDNEKTADGDISMSTKAYLFVEGGVKQIADLESSRSYNVIPEVGAIIDRINVQPEYKRQGIATAMLNFARSYSQDGIKIDHSFSLTDDAKGWSAVVKHGSHDQKTHGSWANGSGSSGLTHREIYNLQVGRGDSLVSKVYKAEDTFQPQLQRELPIPFPPKTRVEYATKEEYDKAYKEYSKNYDEWAKESHRNIKSDLGQKHLDGTKAGVQKYMDNVLDQDWFKSEFGTGGVVPKPQVKLLDINSAGRYVFGFKNGQPYTSMIFNKGFSKAEPTILHEIAHYATTISQREPFDGHGVEFAKNHVYITSKAIGSDYADGLAQAYREEGVDVG